MGACRNYLRNMIVQTPYDDSDDVRWPAFIGTSLGDSLENAMRESFGYTTQRTVEVTLPSGKRVQGHCDVHTDDGVWDFKAVDGVESVKRTGPSFRQKAQVMAYLLALIQSGDLPDDAYCALVFIDRSGRDSKPHVWMSGLDMEVIEEAERRLDDVVYAVMHGEEASRDEPATWCQVACPFYSKCRGAETDVQGLITDESALLAVKHYEEAREMAKAAERLKDEAKATLKGVEGSTGEYIVRWTQVNQTDVPGFTRKAYRKLDIRRLPKGGPKKEGTK